jgi:hypothetical protein
MSFTKGKRKYRVDKIKAASTGKNKDMSNEKKKENPHNT